MSQNFGAPVIVQPQFLDKFCCPICSVWEHENGMESRVIHTIMAVLFGWIYTLCCWKAPSYSKSFV